jgi:hypothetical protein
MEISHASKQNQSAAIGVMGQASEVKVSADGEFMMALAHGIYSNKPLALARELSCNGEDGHKLAGTPNAGLTFTITDNQLTIRDKGTGIPNEVFADNYMTFGKSTKRQLKNQTGGFGVGSKVPWAFCDTFSARNFRDKKMTAYVIMKSDPAIDGQPSCTPLMQIDSIEHSGVEVSVPFEENMRIEIERTLNHFLCELGINATINGQEVAESWIDWDEAKQYGFTRLMQHPRSVVKQSIFYVRLGDVIYPLEPHESYDEAWTMLQHLMAGGSSIKPILFMAEPDSMVPTMSRESLSYTEQTQKAAKQLFVKALQHMADHIDHFAAVADKEIREYFPNMMTFAEQMWSSSWSSNDLISYAVPAIKEHCPNIPGTQLTLLTENLRRWLSSRTPYMETAATNGQVFREGIFQHFKNVFHERLTKLTYMNTERLALLWERRVTEDTYLKEFVREGLKWQQDVRENERLIDVRVIGDTYNLRYLGDNGSYFVNFMTDLKELAANPNPIRLRTHTSTARLMWASKTIVLTIGDKGLSHRNKDMVERLHGPRDNQNIYWKSFLAEAHANLVGARILRLRAGTKETEIEALTAKYRAEGFEVYNLTGPTAREIEEREALAAERAAERAAPLPTLLEMARDYIGRNRHYKKEANLLENLSRNPIFKGQPLYYLAGRAKDLPYQMKNADTLRRMMKLVGSDIVVVSTKPEIARAMKQGRTSLDDALVAVARQFHRLPGVHDKLFYEPTFFLHYQLQNKYLARLLFNRNIPYFDAYEAEILDTLRDLCSTFESLRRYMEIKRRLYERNKIATHYKSMMKDAGYNQFIDYDSALRVAFNEEPSSRRAYARSLLKNLFRKGSV